MEAKPVKLNYKGSSIAKAELQYGIKFFTVLNNLSSKDENGEKKQADFGMSDMLFLYVAGGGSVDTFDKMIIDGTEVLMLDIMEGLAASGFLGTKFNRAEAETAIKKAMKDIETEVSQTSGEN